MWTLLRTRHQPARQAPATHTTQSPLTPDKSDVTGAIRKSQKSYFEGHKISYNYLAFLEKSIHKLKI
jgi:hypothetical protein